MEFMESPVPNSEGPGAPGADPLVQRVVDVGRSLAAIHRRDVPLGIVGVSVEAVVGDVARRIVRVGSLLPTLSQNA
jgi:hypothetical protein